MQELTHFSDVAALDFDTIIDVRSPGEFAEDHVPGAISLPVLDDEERARVGTMYKQVSPFKARTVGAALVFENAARHLRTHLADKPGNWRPLVYCWRGGQRSGAFAWMLKEIGWPAVTVQGGYKSYRRTVVDYLYDQDLPVTLVRLAGHTGTGKTELLARLQARGVQVIDLEGLAVHRGSLLGGMGTPQPSQKTFETRLAMEIHKMDPARPVIVEAESSKIGAITLPPALWRAMKASQVIEISAPIDARAQYLARAYKSVLDDQEGLKAKLAHLRRFRGHEVVDHWNALIDSDDRVALCRSLAVDHYDPAYATAHRDDPVTPVARFQTQAMTGTAFDQLAGEIAATCQTMSTCPT
ncbi:MAG: tRNA 2-selenouridine(34) synthase MnmH [Pseudomonadota bacterium]